MYFFGGKFSHSNLKYANNELWTVLFPRNIQKGELAVVVFQWSESASGQVKENAILEGLITKADVLGSGEIAIELFRKDRMLYYWFEGTISSVKDKMELTMKNPKNEDSGSVKANIIYDTD